MVDVSEKMIEAGVETKRAFAMPLADERGFVRAIYTAMHSAREVDGETVERVAKAISGAAYDYMRSIGFSGGWDHDELGRNIAAAAIAAMGEVDVR